MREVAVGVVGPAVVHQVQGCVALFVGDPVHRQNLGGVHDRGIQPGLHALVQEHRVQHLTGSRIESERDVGQAQHSVDLGIPGLEFADRLDRLDPVATGLLLTGGDREGQGVHQDVAGRHPPVTRQIVDESGTHANLPVPGAGLALLVDRERDHRGAVLGDQRHDALEPRPWAVTVLVVDAVHDRAPAQMLESGTDDVRLGGVQHDRQGGRCGQPRSELVHVGHPVAADIVDADVQHMRAVAFLVAGDLHTLVPVLRQHRFPEGLGTVGVGPLPHGQEREILSQRNRVVERGYASRAGRVAVDSALAVQALDHLPQVLRGGSAAAADEVEAVVGDERLVGVGKLLGRQGVARPVRGELGQARVGHAGQHHVGVAAQVAQMLAHLRRAGRTVQPDGIDAEWFQRCECRADLRTEQHRAGGLDRHADQDRHLSPLRLHGPVACQHRGLGLQQVLTGLDEHRINPAGKHPDDLLGVGITQGGERGVAQCRQLGAGAYGAQNVALVVRR